MPYRNKLQTLAHLQSLHLCGSGPGESALRQQAEDLGISNHVFFGVGSRTMRSARHWVRVLRFCYPVSKSN